MLKPLLRQWKDSDLDSFAALNADPDVMRCFLKALSREESREMMERLRAFIDHHGWGLWAVEVEGELAGFTGLAEPRFSAAFTPCVEIGWRFHRKFWGRNLAFAAARQAELFAFHNLRLGELVSFTATQNLRSQRLMQRLGFTHDPAENFLHPLVPKDHPLRLHVLYRKKNPDRGIRDVP